MKADTKKAVEQMAYDIFANGWNSDTKALREVASGLAAAHGDAVDAGDLEDALERQRRNPEVVLETELRRIGLSFVRHRAGADWSDGAYELVGKKNLFIIVHNWDEFDLVRRSETEDGEFYDEQIVLERNAVAIAQKAKAA